MHQKHPKIKRPATGRYARTEVALVGTTCGRIKRIVARWTEVLEREYAVVAAHGQYEDDEEREGNQRLRYGNQVLMSDGPEFTEFDDRFFGNRYDLALVTGNHFPATRQIVFLDARKADMLERRREQLTEVMAIVFCDEDRDVPAWLTEELAGRQPLLLGLEEVDTLLPLVRELLVANRAITKALILSGGRSERMGTDKGSLVYRNGETELARLARLCRELGVDPHVSVREVEEDPVHDLPQVPDRFLGLGPAGAICSGFLFDPEARWLVLACDLPLLDKAVLQRLLTESDRRKFATAVRGPDQRWGEPLIAIYEPRSYQRLLQFLSLGYACPKKLLINSDVKLLDLADGRAITNANTPAEREQVLALLSPTK